MLSSFAPAQLEPVSIIVPTLNEVESAPSLMARIDAAMHIGRRGYEVIVIDDHSTDKTVELFERLADHYPIRVVMKQGAPGKAQSLIEGFALAQFELVAMIDADLQYPPEALPEMADTLEEGNADIILTHRRSAQTSILRRTGSAVFQFMFARLLFGLDYDTQSGLKLFRKRILTDLHLNPAPWSFDLEFIVRSREKGAVIVEHDILFSARQYGEAKIDFVQASLELARAAVGLKLTLFGENRGKAIAMAIKRQLRTTLIAVAFSLCLSAPAQAEDAPISLPIDPIEILLPTPAPTPQAIVTPSPTATAPTSTPATAKKAAATATNSVRVTAPAVTSTESVTEPQVAVTQPASFLNLTSVNRTSSYLYPVAQLDPELTTKLTTFSLTLGGVGLVMTIGGFEMIATLGSNFKHLFRINATEEM